jgi:hypothetical protein
VQKLDPSAIDLGNGKLDPKYDITVLEDLDSGH